MKVIKGISKGKQSVKDMEIELKEARETIKSLESKLGKATQQYEELVDLLYYLLPFSNKSKTLVTRQDWKVFSKGTHQMQLDILNRIDQHPIAKEDRKQNLALINKVSKSNPDRHKNLLELLHKALKRLNAFKPKSTPRETEAEKEFLQWAETNRDWIIKILRTGSGAKKHIFLRASKSLQISQSAFYDYLKIHFSEK